MALTTALREAALEAGFLDAGWAAASPFNAEARKARAAREQGTYPPFAPEPEEARLPQNALSGARSLLVVAMAYPAAPDPGLGSERGWIARFARGADYHARVQQGLEHLGSVLRREKPGSGYRLFVDAHPLWDKAAAQRAGIGFRGRNTLVLVPGIGSWVHLGGLVTDQVLGECPPTGDGCGSCRACVDACPTGALIWPGRLDHRLCLSFLTQKSGVLPPALRPYLGQRLYGCDDCQEACPRNSWAAPPAGGDEDEAAFPLLSSLLEMDKTRFRRLWGHRTPGWRGRNALRRNAAVAAANSGDRCWVRPLARLLSDPSPVVRGHVAWGLGRLGGPGAMRQLEHARSREREPEVQGEILAALEALGQRQDFIDGGRKLGENPKGAPPPGTGDPNDSSLG